MGCFLACFGSTKDHKRRNQSNQVIPRDNHQRSASQRPVFQAVSVNEGGDIVADPILSNIETRNKAEENLSFGLRKRVTFNSSVKTYEPVDGATEAVEDTEPRKESSGEGKEEDLRKSIKSNSKSEDGSVISSSGSFPPNHRYRNCRDSDDEAEELEYVENDLDEEKDDEDDLEDYVYNVGTEEDADTFCSMESRDRTSVLQATEVDAIGSNENARDRSGYVHSVLNPVENLTQWKAVKARGTPAHKPHKENSALEQEPPRISFSLEHSFKHSSPTRITRSQQSKHENIDMAVDASLSNWLVSAEPTTASKPPKPTAFQYVMPEKNVSPSSNSRVSLEDRPILGALTLKELKQQAVSSSPRKSPSRSPDEMPIIGSVGSFWGHTDSDKDSGSVASYKGIPNTTSKYREDKRVNWHSTPFETRLERALNIGKAEI